MNEGVNLNKVPYVYWSDVTKVSHLQRRIIVYSIMYYQLNESCISDAKYEAISKQLVNMQKVMDPEDLKKTAYYYVMHDFNGSTGFDLYHKLNTKDKKQLNSIARAVLRQWEKENENEQGNQ